MPLDEWVTGPGATPIKETLHHNAKFLSATQEGDMELTMRSYVTRVLKPLVDITGESVESRNELCDSENYAPAQVFSQQIRAQNECGIYYPCVRHEKYFNIAILKPTTTLLA